MRRLNARSPESENPTPAPEMESSKLQFRSSSSSSSSSSSRFSLLSRISSPPNHKNTFNTLWIVVSLSSAIAASICLFFLLKSDAQTRFSIIIDGGSTGTRIHVYSYMVGRGMVLPAVDIGSSLTMKVNPGLSAYKENPEEAGESLVELLEFARRRVRRDLWGETDVKLMATAGMRLLDVGIQERIMDSCRKVLWTSGFRFRSKWATVITGSDEGIYAWITANYALGTLGSDPEKTTGIIELGGASAQITFVSSEPPPPEFSHLLTFGKTTYSLYSHSFLHFGQNVAYESLHEFLDSQDPCTPRGYIHSSESKLSNGGLDSKKRSLSNMLTSGNFSECRSAAMMLLQKGKDKCLYKQCSIGSVFVPELKGRFLATENFFYTSKFLGLGSTPLLSNLVMAGEQFCGEDWIKLKKKYHFLVEEDLLHYCFSSAYIVAMLHDSFEIGLNDRRIEFANQVGNIPLDWALGAFIVDRMAELDGKNSDSIMRVINNNSSVLLVIFILLMLTFTIWLVLKWKKPQLKTIYDLEKGRYIITRVSP